MSRINIGISFTRSDVEKYQNYRNAVERAATAMGLEITTVDLSGKTELPNDLDGILFTGGEDIAPERYGKADERDRCTEIDESRDASEFALAKQATHLPTLGICRGAQLLNVVQGGTLHTDISGHTKLASGDRRHAVSVDPASQLARLTGSTSGEINSSHHQSIDRLGDGLRVTASADGIVEAIERAERTNLPFFLAVQWHPERMEQDSPFARPLFEAFLQAACDYHKERLAARATV